MKKKELEELDAVFAELGIAVAGQENGAPAAGEGKKKKKEKKKQEAAANGTEANGPQSGTAEEATQSDSDSDDEGAVNLDPAAVRKHGIPHTVACMHN